MSYTTTAETCHRAGAHSTANAVSVTLTADIHVGGQTQTCLN